MNRRRERFTLERGIRVWSTLWVFACIIAGYGRPVHAAEVPSQVQELARLLQAGNDAGKVDAADRLSKMGDAAAPAVPAIFNAINGKSSWVDIAMAEALTQLAPVSFPFLLERLQNGGAEIRARALRGMMGMGERLKDARPVLQKASADSDESVRRWALRILQSMDTAGSSPTNGVSAEGVAPAGIGAIRPPAPREGRTSDWPGFRGPDRDGICTDEGLLQEWPAGGPRLLWRLDSLGSGLSSISIAGDKFFVTGDRAVNGTNGQYVFAYELRTRSELWAARIGDAYPEYGALSTPALDGDRLYVTSTDGSVFCLSTGTGAIQWQKNFADDFGGMMMSRWKWSESPLVDGEKVICTPGGTNATMVALNRQTGAPVWRCLAPVLGERGKDGAGYCSAIVAEVEGVRQYVQTVGRGVIAVAADSGKFLWGYNRLANTTANIPGPIVRGGDVFTANGYNTGGALLRLRRRGDAFGVEEVYALSPSTFQNHHGGYVLVGDYVYGGSGSNKGVPTCIEFATGRLMWRAASPASGSACVVYADGNIIFRYDRGMVALVEANPAAFRLRGMFTPPRSDGAAWSYPVIHDRRLYLRDQNILLCYDIRASAL